MAAIVMRAGQVLLGERCVPRVWQFPGGHLHFGESFFACAERETREETGLQIRCLRLGPTTNTVQWDPPSHYATVFSWLPRLTRHTARRCEPDKCLGWRVVCTGKRCPHPLFAPCRPLLDMQFDPFRKTTASGDPHG